MRTADFPDLMTAQEVADALRVSLSTVSRMVQNGTLRAIRIGSRGLRFRSDDIAALINEATHDTEAAS